MKKPVLLLAVVMFTVTSAQAETIKIGGSGSMISLVTELGNAYMKKNPQETIAVNQKSLGLPGGIAALNAGAIDIAMAAVEPTAEQRKQPILPLEIAQVAGVVAVSSNVTVKGITSKQLCDIFSGKITNWKQVGGADAKIIALTRPESESTKMALRKGFACYKNLTEAPEILNLPKAQDMYNTLETKKDTIGPIEMVAFAKSAGKYKSLRIDGNGPEDSASGKWKFILNNHLVLGKNRGDAVKRFLGFVKSAEGQAIIKKNKATPTNFTL